MGSFDATKRDQNQNEMKTVLDIPEEILEYEHAIETAEPANGCAESALK